MDDIITAAMEYVRQLFKNDFGGHDYDHTIRVYRTALVIARPEQADEFIVALSALLHDADDRKLSPATCESCSNARSFLEQHGIADDTAETIIGIIRSVSFRGSDSVIPATIEGKCVQDADRLDAIGAIGIARAFAYGGSHSRALYDPDIPPMLCMNQEQYYNRQSTTLNHFYEKLFSLKDMMNTQTGRQLAQQRDLYMHGFVAEFLSEWNGNDLLPDRKTFIQTEDET